jgi:hypothetical protein
MFNLINSFYALITNFFNGNAVVRRLLPPYKQAGTKTIRPAVEQLEDRTVPSSLTLLSAAGSSSFHVSGTATVPTGLLESISYPGDGTIYGFGPLTYTFGGLSLYGNLGYGTLHLNDGNGFLEGSDEIIWPPGGGSLWPVRFERGRIE